MDTLRVTDDSMHEIEMHPSRKKVQVFTVHFSLLLL